MCKISHEYRFINTGLKCAHILPEKCTQQSAGRPILKPRCKEVGIFIGLKNRKKESIIGLHV